MKNRYGLDIPFFALAPMANITTLPFASQALEFGVDLLWTPMVHTDVILNNWEEARKIIDFGKIKRHLIQIIGNDPDKIFSSIQIIDKKLSPLGIDINLACPDKNIVKSGCGGALLKDHTQALKIVKSATQATKLPISVKTRLGWDTNNVLDFSKELEKLGVAMITIHGRTVKQAFSGTAEWNTVKEVKDNSEKMLVSGSGDIKDYQDALEKVKLGLDGYLIGRASLGRPWIFEEIENNRHIEKQFSDIKRLILEIAKNAEKIWGEKGVIEYRKHFTWYVRGFDGASVLRNELVRASSFKEVKEILSRKY